MSSCTKDDTEKVNIFMHSTFSTFRDSWVVMLINYIDGVAVEILKSKVKEGQHLSEDELQLLCELPFSYPFLVLGLSFIIRVCGICGICPCLKYAQFFGSWVIVLSN